MKRTIFVLMLGLLLIGANLYAAGDLQVNGSIGVGTTPLTTTKLKIISADQTGYANNSSVTTTSALSGANIAVTVDGTVLDGAYSGFSNRILHAGDNTSILRMLAGDNQLQLNSTVSGSTAIVDAAAMRARITNSNTFARQYSFPTGLSVLKVGYDFYATSGGGTVTASNMNGITVGAPSGSILSVGAVSGIWIDQQAAGSSNNYGIVLDGDGPGSDIVFGSSQEASMYSSGGELFVKDGSSNVTQISPHDPETGEWRFYSKNTKTGRVVEVNMEKLIKAVEKLTGETFMIETYDKE